ncbi:MAG: class I SAM-dependent methyltransferase [Candidatus Heimdallarchaeota archaeon]
MVTELENDVPSELLSFLPHRWWKIGDVLIITIPTQIADYQEQIGSAMLRLSNVSARTVLGKLGPTEGVTRVPAFKYLAGDTNTETIHKELGCLFKIDAAKLTFSPGNHGERERLLELVQENECIIDMFTCVGNLSLPIAVHRKPKQVIAAEINPYAFKYLEENIKLNKLEGCMKALLGDNRVILKEFEGQANRVISGYLHADEQQMRQAIRLCKPNGFYHYHEATPSREETQKRPITRIMQAAEAENRKVEIIAKRRVKKYSPGVEHIVVDVRIL